MEEPAETLTAPKVAKMLGVSSSNTVKNWIEGGHFPGAFRTMGGHWRVPVRDVHEAKRRMEELREKNRTRDLTPPDLEDDSEPPLL
jgi:excisionase family DNA binding protein